MSRRRRVYVAGPYTKGDVGTNVRAAVSAADHLWCLGYAPFVPHLSHLWHLMCPMTYMEWLEYDQQWLLVCECLYRLPGESAGTDREIVLAKQAGIPVYYSLNDLLAAAPPHIP